MNGRPPNPPPPPPTPQKRHLQRPFAIAERRGGWGGQQTSNITLQQTINQRTVAREASVKSLSAASESEPLAPSVALFIPTAPPLPPLLSLFYISLPSLRLTPEPSIQLWSPFGPQTNL